VSARRVAAIVLPRLPSELARLARPSLGDGPLAVVLTDDEYDETPGAALVGAVDDAAARLGVRVGERVSEAMARSSEISFTQLSPRVIDEALSLVAEVALGFGPIVEITSADTIVIDITGVDHLFAAGLPPSAGKPLREAAMRDEIAARVASLGLSKRGFRVDVAISDGPFLAQALARFAGIHPDLPRVTPPSEAGAAIAKLPVSALALGPESVAFFGRLGVLSLGDLMRIDRAQLAARLRPFVPSPREVGEVLGWLDGIDARPLVPYEPPAIIAEQMAFEDGVESAPQLVFAVRGLVTRLSSRLVGRRQATNRIDVCIRYDRSIALLRGDATASPHLDLAIDLPAPLSHIDDLFRAIKAKVESLELAAPAVAIEVRLSRIARAPEVQLDLSRDVSVSPDALPALLSELSAEIGVDQVGVLVTVDDHRPEKRSLLSSPTAPPPDALRRNKKSPQLPLFENTGDLGPPEPPRLLPRPIPLGTSADGGRRLSALRAGTTVFIGKVAFTIRHVRFDRRIDGVAWWTKGVVHRDYLRVRLAEEANTATRGSLFGATSSLQGGLPEKGGAEAWVFVDRRTGETFLHGWWE
jgi:protein ImuB